MTNLFRFLLGILCLPILFFVAPISTTIIFGLFLVWSLGWLIVFLVVLLPRAQAAWSQAKSEIKAEDEAWDDLLARYWNTEYSEQLIAARSAGWSPKVAKISIQQSEDALQAKDYAEIEKIRTFDAREDAIERKNKIAYWVARHAKRKPKAKTAYPA